MKEVSINNFMFLYFQAILSQQTEIKGKGDMNFVLYVWQREMKHFKLFIMSS